MHILSAITSHESHVWVRHRQKGQANAILILDASSLTNSINSLCTHSFPETSIIPRPRTVRKRELLAKNHSSIKFFSFIKKIGRFWINTHPYTYLDDFFHSLINFFINFFYTQEGKFFFIFFIKNLMKYLVFFIFMINFCFHWSIKIIFYW